LRNRKERSPRQDEGKGKKVNRENVGTANLITRKSPLGQEGRKALFAYNIA
jgi:hypothetical protein